MTAKPFIHDDFLLDTPESERLYHGYAEGRPIVDYHCHLPPEEIARDKRYANMTEIWLGGDHYKWRAMRSNGVPEEYCTGDAPDREKFQKWAETMPRLLRNPLYHWTHLELARYFGVTDVLLGPDTADVIWETCNARLQDADFSARGLMTASRVEMVGTTDDPVDSLEHHVAVAEDPDFDVKVLPTWRPDKAMAVENAATYNAWVDALAAAADTDIASFDDLMTALRKRHDRFHAVGCRLSDHGLDTFYAESYADAEIQAAFNTIRAGGDLDADAVAKFKSAMLYEGGLMDHEKGWVQQFHVGAMRNNNSRLFAALGPDTGFDSIGDYPIGTALSRLLDRLDSTNQLARTILYNLNPRDNALVASMIGNFQDGSVPGKIQWGSGWWFLDQKDGMEQQLETLSQLGLLSRFVGMLTDSRSFLSYTRHEYFRRILCNMLGHDMVKGLVPGDEALVGNMVEDISYRNAAGYFGF